MNLIPSAGLRSLSNTHLQPRDLVGNLVPVDLVPHYTKGWRRNRPRTILVQAYQHLWLVMHNDAFSSSLLLTMPLSLASHPH